MKTSGVHMDVRPFTDFNVKIFWFVPINSMAIHLLCLVHKERRYQWFYVEVNSNDYIRYQIKACESKTIKNAYWSQL